MSARMTLDDRLTEVFDRGLQHGLDALSPEDRQLFRIQYFILEFEMGGLSGYMYNRLPDLTEIAETVAAMRHFKFLRLADLLEQAAALFGDYRDPDSPTTWANVLEVYDPDKRLGAIADEISVLGNSGYRPSGFA